MARLLIKVLERLHRGALKGHLVLFAIAPSENPCNFTMCLGTLLSVLWLLLVLERVQLFGLVDSPPLDSRVPVDSRVQQKIFPGFYRRVLWRLDSDSRVQDGPASPGTRESQLTALVAIIHICPLVTDTQTDLRLVKTLIVFCLTYIYNPRRVRKYIHTHTHPQTNGRMDTIKCIISLLH